jgi:hypothetical protein
MSNPFDQFDAVADQPRGIRNNNPLNLTGHWDGQIGSDGPFAQFASVDDGRAAADRNLQAYASKHGINTVAGVVSRWAPPSENDTHAYVSKVSDALGVDPNAPLDMSDPQLRTKLLGAMEAHETGQAPAANPFDQFDGAEAPAPRQGPAAALPQPAPTGAPAVINAETGKPYNPAQQAAYAQLIQSGRLDPHAAPGSQAFPRGLTDINDAPKAGEWFVDLDGQLRQSGQVSEQLGFEKGIEKPFANVGNWLGQAAQGAGIDLSGVRQVAHNLQGAQAEADAHEPWRKTAVPGKLGQFAGNMVGTAPLSALPGGALVQGAAGGALLSDSKDAGGVLRDAAIGAVAGKVADKAIGAIGRGAGALLGKAPQVMTLPELEAAKKAAYQAVDESGFVFPKADAQATANNVQAFLAQKGGKTLYPEASQWVARLNQLASQKGGLPLSQLDDLRGDIYTALVKPGGKDSVIGSKMREEIDGLIKSAAAQNDLIRTARDLNTRWAKANVVTKRLESADLARGRAYTGKNTDNTIRQKLSPLIDPMHAARLRNATPDEAAALNTVVTGSPMQNAVRTAGTLLDPRGVIGMGLQATGAAKSGGLSLASVPLGMLSTAVSGRMSQQNVQQLLRLIAAGGSKSALAKAPTPASRAIQAAAAKVRPAAGLSGAALAALLTGG